MKILICSPEIKPLVSIGGLAEYTYGLSTALLQKGQDVRVVLPAYNFVLQDNKVSELLPRFPIRLGPGFSEAGKAYQTTLSAQENSELELPVILLEVHKHFSTALLQNQAYDWPNPEPWAAFSRAVIDFLNYQDWLPEIIHCQDAHTSLVPVHIQEKRKNNPASALAKTKTVLSIHNLLYQGIDRPEILHYAGLPWDLYDLDHFEFYSRANCLKAGLNCADLSTTVSPTYAWEICQWDEFGFGLAGFLNQLQTRGKLKGILNAIQHQYWSMPGLDYLSQDKEIQAIHIKQAHKDEFFSSQKISAPKEPVLGFRGRWDLQKGIDLLVEGLEEILAKARFLLVTWGTPGKDYRLQSLWQVLNQTAEARPDRLFLNPEGFSFPEESWKHYAVADFMLMPSRYEPCGLIQLECQRFGAIPIARKTGGLADTVFEQESFDIPSPNGFLFAENNSWELLQAVNRACGLYYEEEKYRQVVKNCLEQPSDWEQRVQEYLDTYFGLLE